MNGLRPGVPAYKHEENAGAVGVAYLTWRVQDSTYHATDTDDSAQSSLLGNSAYRSWALTVRAWRVVVTHTPVAAKTASVSSRSGFLSFMRASFNYHSLLVNIADTAGKTLGEFASQCVIDVAKLKGSLPFTRSPGYSRCWRRCSLGLVL